MLKIGVTACFFYPDPSRGAYSKKTLTYIENDTVDYLADRGVFPVLIPNLPMEKLSPLLDELDGLLCQGGSDVSPKSYGEELIEDGKWPGDEVRDIYELKVIDYFFKKKKPIFGICRGHQILNVYFKGTLYQDLKTQTGTEIQHRDAELYDEIYHTIDLVEGEILSKLYDGKKNVTVNSVHHQGVKKLGENLTPLAYCPDDKIIESFRHNNMKENFVLAVQWHPEFSHTLKDTVITPWPLIDYFLEQF